MNDLTPTITITNEALADYLGVRDDTRRAVQRRLGLPRRRGHALSEVWAALGLAPEQPEAIRAELAPRTDGTSPFWDAARAAAALGVSAATVNRWTRGRGRPEGFPPPLFEFSAKTRLWLRVEMRAWREPSIYADLARQVRRRPCPAGGAARTPLV